MRSVEESLLKSTSNLHGKFKYYVFDSEVLPNITAIDKLLHKKRRLNEDLESFLIPNSKRISNEIFDLVSNLQQNLIKTDRTMATSLFLDFNASLRHYLTKLSTNSGFFRVWGQKKELEEDIDSYFTSKIKGFTGNLYEFTKELHSLTNRISESMSFEDISFVNRKKAFLKEQIRNLFSSNSKGEEYIIKDIKEAKAKLDSQSVMMKSYLQEINDLKQENNRKTNLIGEYTAKLEDMRKECLEISKEYQSLGNIQAYAKDFSMFADQVFNDLNSKAELLESKIDKISLNALFGKVNALRTENSELVDHLKLMQEEYLKVMENLKMIQEASSEFEEIKQTMENMQEVLAKKAQEIASLQAINKNKQEQIEELQALGNEKKSLMKNIETENKALRNNVEELQELDNEKEFLMRKIESENKTLRKNVEELQALDNEKKSLIRKIESENKALRNNVEELKAAIDGKREDFENMYGTMLDTHKSKEQLLNQMSKSKMDNQRLMNELEEMIVKLGKAEKENYQLKAYSKELEKILSSNSEESYRPQPESSTSEILDY